MVWCCCSLLFLPDFRLSSYCSGEQAQDVRYEQLTNIVESAAQITSLVRDVLETVKGVQNTPNISGCCARK